VIHLAAETTAVKLGAAPAAPSLSQKMIKEETYEDKKDKKGDGTISPGHNRPVKQVVKNGWIGTGRKRNSGGWDFMEQKGIRNILTCRCDSTPGRCFSPRKGPAKLQPNGPASTRGGGKFRALLGPAARAGGTVGT